MKKRGFIFLALSIVVCFLGCGKKQEALQELQEPMSIEDLTRISSVSPQVSQTQTSPGTLVPEPSLPPAASYKPTNQEIQTALKNAGYYTGPIDGKIGSLTKKATEEFQQANGLKVDGKVGPKTWTVLSKYLHPEPVLPPTEPAKKKR